MCCVLCVLCVLSLVCVVCCVRVQTRLFLNNAKPPSTPQDGARNTLASSLATCKKGKSQSLSHWASLRVGSPQRLKRYTHEKVHNSLAATLKDSKVHTHEKVGDIVMLYRIGPSLSLSQRDKALPLLPGGGLNIIIDVQLRTKRSLCT